MKPNQREYGRRVFLRRAISASLAAGVISARPSSLFAQECVPEEMPRTLVNFMLQGGADFRYLFIPSPGMSNTAHLQLMWTARQSLYNGDYDSYQQMFDNEYLLATDPLSGMKFGIHRQAAWLKAEFDGGRVAVIANAYCSRNRRHDQSILNADAGEPDFDTLNFDRDGWGGRMVEHMGAGLNSVELGNSVTTFNKGTVRGSRLAQVVHAQDMRDLSLPRPDPQAPASRRSIIARALGAYYQGRGPELATGPGASPYIQYFQHHDALLGFAGAVEDKLATCNPLPEELAELQLANDDFAQQCRNLFDVCQVPAELNLGVVSMSYGGWDTHNNEAAEIGQNLADIFGEGQGLETAMTAIAGLPHQNLPPAEQLVFNFASDFGRQIVANGAAGTDHGRGTYNILIGKAIKGGLYGDMFPEKESRPDENGQVPLETPGADIEGLTSTDRILSHAVDWVQPGSGAIVFPASSTGGLESGVKIDSIFPS